MGAIAAAVAVLSIEPRLIAKDPRRALARALWAGLVWLVVAWLLGGILSIGTGSGRGEAGTGSGTGAGPSNIAGQGTDAARVTAGAMPGGTPNSVVLLIRFVPSGGNPAVAQDFACDLHRRGTEGNATKVEIRAGDMPTFEKLLVQHLRDFAVPADAKRPEVRIGRVPFPGEPALRRVGDAVRAVLPSTSVVFDQ